MSMPTSLVGGRPRTRKLPVAAEPKVVPPVEPPSLPLPKANAYAGHRNLKKGIVPASELQLPEAEEEQTDPLDYVCVARFPPGVAAVLRRRLADSFGQAVSTFDDANASPLPKDVSSRGPLGLSIMPTANEDYRLMDVHLDLMDDGDLRIMSAWHPKFDVSRHPPLIYHKKQPTPENKKKKPKAKALSTMAEAEVKVEATVVPALEPICTIKLQGLLTELPTLIEAYKSLDLETMVKAANISQMLVVTFPEDQSKTYPTALIDTPGVHECHTCVEQMPPPDVTTQYFDVNRLLAPRCPWLWPSGITPPMQLYRERKVREVDLFSKAEVQACEMAIMAILKRGRQEWCQLEVASALECYMHEEALQPQTTVPSAHQVLSPNPDSRIVYVVADRQTDMFDDPPSDLSDTMFGDDHNVDERDLMEDRAAVARKKKEKKVAGPISVAAVPGQATGFDAAAKETLMDEFKELAENVVREELEAELEAELEDDFYSGTVLDDENEFMSNQK